MKNISIKWLILALVVPLFNVPNLFAGGAVVITEPATARNSFKSCKSLYRRSWS